jgi:hypothetical protein
VKLRLLVVVLLACATATSHAQAPAPLPAPLPALVPAVFDPATLDPSVMLVISGGRWDTGAQRGTFRVLMLRGELAPARSRVVVQWLEEQPAVVRRIVVHSSRDVDAIPNGTWSLAAPRLELRGGHWYAVIVGTTDAGRIRRTWRFALDVPGKLREVQLP